MFLWMQKDKKVVISVSLDARGEKSKRQCFFICKMREGLKLIFLQMQKGKKVESNVS